MKRAKQVRPKIQWCPNCGKGIRGPVYYRHEKACTKEYELRAYLTDDMRERARTTSGHLVLIGRTMSGLSTDRVARMLGMSRQRLRRIENGQSPLLEDAIMTLKAAGLGVVILDPQGNPHKF